MTNELSTRKLILVPAVITLGVTLLRLTGELMHWSPLLFNRAAGGGRAIVGIAWLVPFFGAWFGWKLAHAGERPGSVGKAIGFAVLGFVMTPAIGFLAVAAGPRGLWRRVCIMAALGLGGGWVRGSGLGVAVWGCGSC